MIAAILEKENRKCEFKRKLNAFFKPSIELYKTEKAFKWETIFDFVERHMDDILHYNTFGAFCKYLIKLLNDYECYDRLMVTRIIYLYKIRRRDFSSISREMGDSAWNPRRGIRVILEDIFSREEPKYTFGDASLPLSDSGETAIFYGDVKFMETLMRYGIYYHPSKDFFSKLGVSILETFFMRWHFRGDCFEPIYLTGCNVAVDRVLEQYTNTEENAGIRRIHLIIMVLNALTSERDKIITFGNEFDSEFGRCLLLFFQTVKEPYITVQEIENFLRSAVDNKYNNDTIEEICSHLKQLSPKNIELYRPRSLLHLCRWQVRKNLEVAGALLDGVSKLKIPDSVKDYILIKNY